MKDYEALIRAVLNVDDVNKTIAALQNQTVSMKLDLKTGNVSIDSFLRNIQTQMKSAGQQAGNSFTNAFSGGLKTWSNNNAHTMQELQRTLAGFKFQRGDINKVTQDLEHMNLEISKVTTKINNNNLRVTVSGIDELGRAVTIVKEFDHRAGELSTVGKVISQTFETSADAVDKAFKKVKETSSEMAKLGARKASLNPVDDAKEIEAINDRYKELRQTLIDLRSQYGSGFSDQQNAEIQSTFKKMTSDIKIAKGQIADTSAYEKQKQAAKDLADSQRKSFNELYDLQTKMFSSQKTYVNAKAQGQPDAYVNKLKSDFEAVKNEYNNLMKSAKGNLSAEQFDLLIAKARQSSSEIENLKLKIGSNVELKVNSEDFQNKLYQLWDKFTQIQDRSKSFNINVDTKDVEAKLLNVKKIQDRIANSNDGVERARLFKDYASAVADAESALDQLLKTEEKENQIKQRSETLSNKMTAWLNNNKEAAKQYGSQIEKLQESLKDNSDQKIYQDAALGFQKIQAQAKAAGLTVDSFGASLKNAAKQALGLTSAFAIIQKAKQIFKDMYQQLYDIDTAMTNLYKVTDETASKYSSFLKQAKKDAQDMGRTVSDMIEQTATWAKLGYNIDEAASLSKISSVYANVGEISNETAVSDMVTAMKTFKIAANDAVTIVDPLNELGNTFATSAGDLGAGLSKSASTLQLAGATMNETLAMLTGGAEITQNAQEFGNALKVGVMRIRGMKGELEALGEEVDDNVESISKMQTQILNLTHGKVNIFNDDGEFKNVYEIYKGIADVFGSLKSTEQADLVETLFGKVRGNQGMALISAFQSGQVQKALETANNSAGSAAAEQEKWMESFEAKTNTLKASWQGLSESFLNSDFLKGAIDSGTAFLNVMTKIVDVTGGLPPLIAAITAGASAFKNIGRDKTSSLIAEYADGNQFLLDTAV